MARNTKYSQPQKQQNKMRNLGFQPGLASATVANPTCGFRIILSLTSSCNYSQLGLGVCHHSSQLTAHLVFGDDFMTTFCFYLVSASVSITRLTRSSSKQKSWLTKVPRGWGLDRSARIFVSPWAFTSLPTSELPTFSLKHPLKLTNPLYGVTVLHAVTGRSGGSRKG